MQFVKDVPRKGQQWIRRRRNADKPMRKPVVTYYHAVWRQHALVDEV